MERFYDTTRDTPTFSLVISDFYKRFVFSSKAVKIMGLSLGKRINIYYQENDGTIAFELAKESDEGSSPIMQMNSGRTLYLNVKNFMLKRGQDVDEESVRKIPLTKLNETTTTARLPLKEK